MGGADEVANASALASTSAGRGGGGGGGVGGGEGGERGGEKFSIRESATRLLVFILIVLLVSGPNGAFLDQYMRPHRTRFDGICRDAASHLMGLLKSKQIIKGGATSSTQPTAQAQIKGKGESGQRTPPEVVGERNPLKKMKGMLGGIFRRKKR